MVAFIGGGLMLLLFIFKIIPAKLAITVGGGLAAVGYITQPASTTADTTV